jgi:arsenite/tail-anchored protein-transporting ATPase
MRIIVFTGKGGVGKTSVASATALASARRGARTLVMSTDPAHSLGDAFEAEIGTDPTRLADGLDGLQIDAQQRLEEHFGDIQAFLTQFMAWAGADPIAAEEITMLPGVEEIFSLTDILRFSTSGLYDTLVVDCAPTAETLRLLSLPEVARWYMERVFPMERKVVKMVRPVLSRMSSMPVAPEAFFSTVERMYTSLAAVGTLLADQKTSSVRLVVNPEKMVIAEAQRMFTYLALFGYRVDAVIANRLLPDTIEDPYFQKWKKIQAHHLETIVESFAPVPVLKARLYDEELVGPGMLGLLAEEVYGDLDPTAVLHKDDPMRLRKQGDKYVLTLRLPRVEGRLDANRRGEDLILTVGSYRRTLPLPASLRRREILDASFEGTSLKVIFGEQPSRS